ncbi:hypothetical protein [Clostridium sp. 1001283B150225_161107_B6]|uniref:hypothetical protein n=1 Tax=Clostridium sp. 1001283B150225_161107_B6 TaxID=2787141 RepID=UPI001A9BA2C1|nr:hypothetical protein [Clostridium sp. 1001283B150225_161107_B6]
MKKEKGVKIDNEKKEKNYNGISLLDTVSDFISCLCCISCSEYVEDKLLFSACSEHCNRR